MDKATNRIESEYLSISVIVPVYNVVHELKRCVDSILKQSFVKFELLLVDDGSDDGSGEICDRYCALDKRCKVIHQPHSGVGNARNAGLDIAVGDYVAFVDADDYLHPRYLEFLHQSAHNRDSKIVLVDYNIVGNSHSDIGDEIEQTIETKMLTRKDLLSNLFSEISFMVVWGKLYERKLLNGSRFENFLVAEDIEFNSRVYQLVENAVYADVRLYNWVNRPSSATRANFSEKNINALKGYEKAMNNIPRSESWCRAFALQRLYKVILYTRNEAPLEFRNSLKSEVKPIVGRTYVELIKNGHIPAIQKCILLTFYFAPSLYILFRKTMEWWVRV